MWTGTSIGRFAFWWPHEADVQAGTMTPAIVRYRTEHRIKPAAAFRPHGKVLVCATDGIRIHANAGGRAGWRHDAAEVKAAALESYRSEPPMLGWDPSEQ